MMKITTMGKTAWGLLGGFLAFNLAANIFFKEGAANSSLYWPFFIAGNILGITSTLFVMRLYQRLNANVAMAMTSSLGFVSVQLVFWRLYRSPLDALQWGGIGLILIGTVMAAWRPLTSTADDTAAAKEERA